MARKNNPINDIINTVGGWLGGRGPGTNPQVQAAMQATRAVGKVVDTATGGFGQALVSDAQRMAQSGSSTPSALYKTAAVNLGAAAAGVGAAKVAGKVASKVVDARVAKELRSLQPTNMRNIMFHAGGDKNAMNAFDVNYKPVHARQGSMNVHMGTEPAAVMRQGQRSAPASRATIDRYEIMNPQAVSKRKYSDNALRPIHKAVQTYDYAPTPKNKILKYVNDVEAPGSVSYLVPKTRVDINDVVYRGTKRYEDQFISDAYTSPQINRLKNVQLQIAANQSTRNVRGAVAGVAVGVAVPKKKARGGGKNKK